jgi:hypothetical protein
VEAENMGKLFVTANYPNLLLSNVVSCQGFLLILFTNLTGHYRNPRHTSKYQLFPGLGFGNDALITVRGSAGGAYHSGALNLESLSLRGTTVNFVGFMHVPRMGFYFNTMLLHF